MEAWRYLSDVLMMIISRQFLDTEEPVTLLICGNTCFALEVLLRHSEGTAGEVVIRRHLNREFIHDLLVRAFLSSPWTASLCSALQKIISHGDSYTNMYLKALYDELLRPAQCVIRDVRTIR